MVLLPLWDRNRIKIVPYQFVTLAIVLANIVIHFTFRAGLFPALQADSAQLMNVAVMPERLLGGDAFTLGRHVWAGFPVDLPAIVTLVTYPFLHDDMFHLATNMIFLWVFGDNVEDAMGHGKFIVFYLLCGIAAGLTQALAQPAGNSLLIGASGAVAGVIGAYLLLYPRAQVWTLVMFKVPLPLNAFIVLGGWIAIQAYFLLYAAHSHVSWWSHIGGFAAGVLLAAVMRRRDVPLFGGGDHHNENA